MNAPRRAHSSMPISEVLMIDRNGITKVSDRAIRKAMLNTPNTASLRVRCRYIYTAYQIPVWPRRLATTLEPSSRTAASSALNRPTAVANEYFRLMIPERYT